MYPHSKHEAIFLGYAYYKLEGSVVVCLDAVGTHLTGCSVWDRKKKLQKKMMTSEQHLEVMGKLKWKGKYPSPSQ